MKNGTDVDGSLLLLHVFLGAIVGGAGYMILALVLERTFWLA